MNTARWLTLLIVTTLALGGCMTREVRPVEQISAIRASSEIPPEQLLDVGVRLFDPNVPEDEKAREKAGIFPEVRKAEARFIPTQLRNTLEGTGQWGQVRVIPAESDAMDVWVSGRIIESSGMELKVDVTVSDATGRVWYTKTYEAPADTRSYKDSSGRPRDPFQNLYAMAANDMLAARDKLTTEDLAGVRRVSDLRFASDLASYAFQDYLSADKHGLYRVVRMPADDDPMMLRMERLRDRDYALVDTLNEHYAVFSDNMSQPYLSWRRYSYDELEAVYEAKRSATNRKLLGAAAIIGGLLAGTQSDSYMGEVAGAAAIIGGAYAIKSGFDKSADVKMHSESLKQLTESFQNEVQPMVVDVEGRTLQLSGSAEEQYHEWRQLLKELYENETGMPAASANTPAEQVASPRP